MHERASQTATVCADLGGEIGCGLLELPDASRLRTAAGESHGTECEVPH